MQDLAISTANELTLILQRPCNKAGFHTTPALRPDKPEVVSSAGKSLDALNIAIHKSMEVESGVPRKLPSHEAAV
jgi:hypothetical protein